MPNEILMKEKSRSEYIDGYRYGYTRRNVVTPLEPDL